MSSRSIAATVPRTRGSSGGRKPTSGHRSRLASSSLLPKHCMKVLRACRSPACRSRVHVVANLSPTVQRCLQFESLCIAHHAIESDPGHDLGMGEMAAATPHFPDSIVRLLPDLFQMLDQVCCCAQADATEQARPCAHGRWRP